MAISFEEGSRDDRKVSGHRERVHQSIMQTDLTHSDQMRPSAIFKVSLGLEDTVGIALLKLT